MNPYLWVFLAIAVALGLGFQARAALSALFNGRKEAAEDPPIQAKANDEPLAGDDLGLIQAGASTASDLPEVAPAVSDPDLGDIPPRLEEVRARQAEAIAKAQAILDPQTPKPKFKRRRRSRRKNAVQVPDDGPLPGDPVL